MHVAIFEPNYIGHHFTHVKRLLPTLAALGVKVTFVTSRQGVASREYAEQIKPVEHHATIESSMEYDEHATSKHHIRSFAENLRRVARDLAVDHLYLPYADGTIQTIGILRLTGRFLIPPNVETECLMMRGKFAYDPSTTLKARLRSTAWITLTTIAPFNTIHHTDPIVYRALQRRAPTLARRVRLIPDPVEPFTPLSRQDARRYLGIPENGRYIGCVGLQDHRKGIDRLIRAFLDSRTAPTDRLFLAGKQSTVIKGILAGEAAHAVADGRIVSLDRYLSDEELCLGIAAMDVVCAPYPPDAGHIGSSSIVIHAAGQQRPCLGSDYAWVGDTVRRFGLGAVCDVMNQPAFAAAIKVSLDSSAEFRLPEGGKRFVEFHRPENFTACFTRRLRERLNLPPLQGLREWAWVEEAAIPQAPTPNPRATSGR